MKKIFLFFVLGCSPILSYAQITFPALYFNTYYGIGAFDSNTTGNHNAAFGPFALTNNTTGNYNTAMGSSALYNANATGNVGIGRRSLYNTTSGGSNTAVGHNAMQNNITGFANVAVGNESMNHNTGGYWNTAVGQSAGPAFGHGNLYNATAIGYYALNTGNAQVRIGNEFVTDIGGHVSWSTLSDGRFKKDIQEDIAGLDFINALRPVSYTVDEGALARSLSIPDSISRQLQAGRKAAVRQTGFVAQEVEALIKKGNYSFNAVKAPQNQNDHYSIRYAEFVVPLVKAVQELTAKLDAQEDEIKALKRQLGALPGNESVVAEGLAQNQRATLSQNKPNPFSAGTEIAISLPDDVRSANLVFYTIEGRQLKVLHLYNRGDFTVTLESKELGSGMCFYALMVDGDIIDSKRLIITGK